jgi:hypothetical protein
LLLGWQLLIIVSRGGSKMKLFLKGAPRENENGIAAMAAMPYVPEARDRCVAPADGGALRFGDPDFRSRGSELDYSASVGMT